MCIYMLSYCYYHHYVLGAPSVHVAPIAPRHLVRRISAAQGLRLSLSLAVVVVVVVAAAAAAVVVVVVLTLI